MSEWPMYLKCPNGSRIAYEKLSGKRPGVVFLGGFHSDMTGTKATALLAHCRSVGRAFVRFDYTGHGESSGSFEDGTIGGWTEDAVSILDEVAEGPQVLVGSSMGGWIMLLAALRRPERVSGLVGIASAPDFTEDLIWNQLSEDAQSALKEIGRWYRPSEYEGEGYPITMRLIEEGREHLLLRGEIEISSPVRLIHGMKDTDVPWRVSKRLSSALVGDDVTLTLVKNGDHRLSAASDIGHLKNIVENLCCQVEC